MDEVVCIRRCLAGDTEAFSELVRKHQMAVYRLCLHKVGNPIEAQDLAQEAFVTAYLDLAELKDAEKFSHWLYRIASNVCHSWLRKQLGKRQIQAISLEDILELDEHPVDAAPSPQTQIEYQELRSSVDQAMGTLSEKNRLVVTLYYIDGLSYQELSDFLDIPITTIKSRLNKARRHLKEEFIKMVASKSTPLPDNFAEKVVQEALAQAKTYRQEHKFCEVVAQCDVALDTLSQMADTPQHLRWKSDALHLKGNALYFPRGDAEAIPYYEQVLELKKRSGDQRDYANYLNFIASIYRGEKAIAAYRQALALFEVLGDHAGQAESHLWLGAQAFFAEDCEAALEHFQHAAHYYAQADDHQDWKAVCHAAIRVTQAIKGTSRANLSRVCAVCETLRRELNQVVYESQPGFTLSGLHPSDHIMGVSLFPAIAQMKPIVATTWQVGQTREQEVFSYTFKPLRAKKTFESDSEMVRTPAGEFGRCWKFRIEATQQPIEEMDEQTRRQYELNKIGCGLREFWFAPGVGLVKYCADQESGLKGTIELAAYAVHHSESDYFPLAVGNWWEYRPVGLHPNYVYKDRFEVIDQENERFFISHCQYAYWNGSEEELQATLERSV